METPHKPRIVFYNTMTKRKEVFRERSPGVVKIFTCGPSIYRRPHMGNYRTYVFEDVLQRYLEYRGFSVERLINFTDLEDKAIAESEDRHVALSDLTEPNAQIFLSDGELLKLKLPRPIPRSTNSVDQAAELIARLLERGHAYRHDGNVYYDALSHPSFGAVYGLDLSKWPKKRYRYSKDTYPGQRWNLGDFILWHGHKDGRYSWDTKIGKGRPAWNVQDPAIITKHLGYELDIHCGGIDNVYRHHDYNRAVVEGVTGTEFVHYWMHGEHLFVDNEKMSKSKGNVIYPEQLIDTGRSAAELRFFLMYGYYRRKGNLTDKTLDHAAERLRVFTDRAEALLSSGNGKGAPEAEPLIDEISPLFEVEMDNDLHVEKGVDNLVNILGAIAPYRDALSGEQVARIRTQLTAIDHVLQILDLAPVHSAAPRETLAGAR